ncbi:glycerol-3-phosphate 1-O-acyltransferase PlsY [Eubacteriales bacterium OttesenSCG-928-M02]|nr:glycerol-3-phosphate 1-O-acyltransferase PlsY [Eubacteriales bacterium OttesenSCG-928-M02]
MYNILAILIAYLIGSIPTSVILTRLFLKDDIRQHGSGNPGTSNMTRTYGVRLGAITLILDALKGVAAVFVGLSMVGEAGRYYCGIAAVIGHDWPIFLKFKGGKGIATSFGVLLAIMPGWALLALLVFLLVTIVTRYFSLGSLCALFFFVIVVLVGYMDNPALVFTTIILAVIGVFRHWENIKRLRAGTENKL